MKRTARSYAQALYLALKEKKDLKKLAKNFYEILRKNRDLNLLQLIFPRLEKIIAQEEKVLLVRLETAPGFNLKQEKELRKILEKKLGKKIEFLKTENPQLLGGLKLKIEDAVYDSSILGKLESIGENL